VQSEEFETTREGAISIAVSDKSISPNSDPCLHLQEPIRVDFRTAYGFQLELTVAQETAERIK
jgi:hypothetical protein